MGRDGLPEDDRALTSKTTFLSYREIGQYLSPYSEDCDRREYYQNHVRTLFEATCPLFSRSSNWQKSLQADSKATQYSTRYKVGSPVQDVGMQMYEIQEILVTVDLANDDIELRPIQLALLMKSKNLQSKSVSDVKRLGEPTESRLNANERLVPDVDDDGSIHGVYMMLNTFSTERPPLDLIDDEEEIKRHPSLQDDPKKAQWLISKRHQKAFVTHIEGWFDTYVGRFEDGESFKLEQQDKFPLFVESNSTD